MDASMVAFESSWTLRVFVVVTVALVEVHAYGGTPNRHVSSENQLKVGSECQLKDGSRGVCRPLSECPTLATHGYQHNTAHMCSWNTLAPIVCCREASGSPPQPSGQGWQHWNPGWPPIHQQPSANWQSVPPIGPSTASSTRTPPTTPSPASSSAAPPTTRMSKFITSVGDKSKRACQVYSYEVSMMAVYLIYNGQKVQPGEFPHMAILGYRPAGQTDVTWDCGGTLISRRFVLSAAHCFSNRILRAPVVVRLGELDLLDDDDNAEDYTIKKWKIHPDYHPQSWYHDLALLQLDREVVFNLFIQPACLWTQPQDPSTGLIVTGWGATDMNGGPTSPVLLKGNRTLKRVDPTECIGFYRRATLQLRHGIQDGILCAVDEVGAVDTCTGDSGGPLQVESDEEVSYYVVGVVSGGYSLCGIRVPSVFIRVYPYLDWIEKIVWPEDKL